MSGPETLDLLQAAQDTEPGFQMEETFRFLAIPDAWIVGLLILPAAIAFAWWCYGGLKRLEPRTRWLLSALRGLALSPFTLGPLIRSGRPGGADRPERGAKRSRDPRRAGRAGRSVESPR